jgi:hypothetical protein
MRPTNTTKQAHDDPLMTLLSTMGSGGIERQEARGQQELVKSESLPAKCRDREALEAVGVKFGQPYPDDPLFCDVVLPAGWKKQATDHSMWSHLLDEKGRKRASIFYKAAHYDRRADMHVERRYSMSVFEDGSDSNHRRAVVKDGETTIHDLGEYRSRDYDKSREMETAATNWLNENFPDWQSASAYWD